MSKTALVFGHSSGLGEAIAKQLLEDDYKVIGIARKALEVVSSRLTNLSVDLSKEDEVSEVVAQIKQDFPKFDVLIFCTGTLSAHNINELDYSEMEFLYRVNVFAPLTIESHLLDLVRANGADIVNITSSALVDYYPKFAEYSSSKASFAKFTNDLKKELKDTPSRVFEVCPSGFTSSIYKTMSGEKVDRDESKQMKSEDIARLIKFVLDLPKKIAVSYLYIDRK